MNPELDIKACRRLLNEIADLSDHASLTGSMASGARRTADRYNTVLNRLMEANEVASDLFTTLPETADFGEIGVEARMLAGYLSGDSKHKEKDGGNSIILRLAPFIGQAELSQLVRDQAKSPQGMDMGTIANLAPFLGQEYLSAIVRDNLVKASERRAAPPAEPPAPTPKAPAPPSVRVVPTNSTPVPLEANEQGVGHLLDMLQDASLTESERQHVIERIRIATG